ncbi:MFS transporter [Kitasatospora sp. NBC_01250]|uniref:MFS transporter n=1 Tax=Kitasatospora sp. NBC_01250 TaxID=2903571 RepID=UPI002E35BAC0|nr:MFS transporter [Kitasatospora sp. NBC_01250]
MSSRAREAGRSTAHHAPTPAPGPIPEPGPATEAIPLPPLVALFAVGCLPAYLLPTIVGRLGGEFGLTPTQAGGVGSALLLAAGGTGLTLAGRVRGLGAARVARAGLALVTAGFTIAALVPTGSLAVLVVGCLVGGIGAGTASAVAGTSVAAAADPHRATVLGLLATSTIAAGLYLVLPRLGAAHPIPYLAVALLGLLALPLTTIPLRPSVAAPPAAVPPPADAPAAVPSAAVPPAAAPTADAPNAAAPAPPARHPLPHRAAGLVMASTMVLWAVAQNALWGVSGQIGRRLGLSERDLGLVFALALGAALLGVLASGALGTRFGRALPIGLGTAAIAACVALSAGAGSVAGFAGGEVLWNALYPLVLSYLIGLATELDPAGRWTVLVGAATTLGGAAGPLTGATLFVQLGPPLLAAALGGTLLLTTVPLVLLARTFGTARAVQRTAQDEALAPVTPIPAQRAVDSPDEPAAPNVA